jgi:hypothetical protein
MTFRAAQDAKTLFLIAGACRPGDPIKTPHQSSLAKSASYWPSSSAAQLRGRCEYRRDHGTLLLSSPQWLATPHRLTTMINASGN